MRKTLLVPMAATMLVTGCSFDLDLGGDWSGFGGIGPCCSPGITMTPSTSDLLLGDTIRLTTFFFPTGSDSTSWTVGDSAFRQAGVTGPTRDTLIVVAARRGSAMVMASRGGTVASLMLNAHDSADVSSVRVIQPAPGTITRVGLPDLWTDARLFAGSGHLGGHKPTLFSSDTTKAIIVLKPTGLAEVKQRAFVAARAVGQVYIIATWGSLRDSVLLTITP